MVTTKAVSIRAFTSWNTCASALGEIPRCCCNQEHSGCGIQKPQSERDRYRHAFNYKALPNLCLVEPWRHFERPTTNITKSMYQRSPRCKTEAPTSVTRLYIHLKVPAVSGHSESLSRAGLAVGHDAPCRGDHPPRPRSESDPIGEQTSAATMRLI